MVQRKAAAFVRWHEPCEARVSRTVLWGAQGEIPWAYPAKAEVTYGFDMSLLVLLNVCESMRKD